MFGLLYITLALFALLSFPALPQSTATLAGTVRDTSGSAVPDASLTLRNAATGFARQTVSAPDGAFVFRNLPLQSYELVAEKAGFSAHIEAVTLRSNIPVERAVTLLPASVQTTVEVSISDRAALVDPQETSTRAQMNQTEIERLTSQAGARGLEGVLLTFPGFSQNANGAIHPRGAHNQMTYVIDGMPISDQLTGAFANAVDPNIVQTVELFTSNIPAEYGSKTSAVANVTTRSGMGSGRVLGGSAMVSGSEFSTMQGLLQLAGERGRWGYSGSVNTMKTQRYLDQVSLDNLHNGGNLERGHLRVDYQPSGRDTLRWNMLTGRSSFESANLRSQQANGMRQRQGLADVSAMFGWVRTLNAATTFDITASMRTANAELTPSLGDTPVTAEQSRRLTTYTWWNRYNAVRGSHTFKVGLDVQAFPVSEQFTFGITNAGFNAPGSEGYISTLHAFDLTRGGRLFRFQKSRTGAMYTGFAQDNVKWGRWVFSLGLRYDNYRFLVNGQQFQPRIGVAYHLRETGTVLRASYNRTYQTPPNENLLLSNSEEASVLVAPDARETLGGALVLIKPETQNFYEVGLQQGLFGRASLNVSYYHKAARDQQDNNNFFNTGIIFPMTLARIRVNGVEGRLVLPSWRGFTATVAATHARAISTPPFTGGLFIGNMAVDALSAGPFVIDHDQKLGLQTVVQWSGKKGWFWTGSVRYDSGLVTNPSDPDEVALDPDHADLLPYVNLRGTPPRTLPRTITDVSAGYARMRNERRVWELGVQVGNLFDKTALFNFQSLFVGTRVVAPRTVGARLRWFF